MRFILFLLLLLPVGLFAQVVDDETNPRKENVRPYRNAPPEKDEKVPFSNRLVLGGTFGLGFSNGWFINVSPTVGYRITDNLIAGVGGTYIFSQFRDNVYGVRYNMNVYGGNVFGRYAPFATTDISFLSNLYLHGEYQHLFFEQKIKNGQGVIIDSYKTDAPGLLLGGGYTTNFGRGPAFNVDVLYNVLWTQQTSPYPSPLLIRAGFSYGL